MRPAAATAELSRGCKTRSSRKKRYKKLLVDEIEIILQKQTKLRLPVVETGYRWTTDAFYLTVTRHFCDNKEQPNTSNSPSSKVKWKIYVSKQNNNTELVSFDSIRLQNQWLYVVCCQIPMVSSRTSWYIVLLFFYHLRVIKLRMLLYWNWGCIDIAASCVRCLTREREEKRATAGTTIGPSDMCQTYL